MTYSDLNSKNDDADTGMRIGRRAFAKLAATFVAAGLATPLLNTPLFAQAAADRKVLRIACIADPEILDPNFSLTDTELRIGEMLFNGLVTVDDKLNIVPDLAESWTVSDDAKTFEFKLRKGVKFHHGREFTGDDVAFTFERLKKSWVATVIKDLEKVDVVDPYTVRFVFTQPAAYFLGSIAPRWCAIVPRDEAERLGDKFKTAPVGTGAYRFKELVTGQRLVMERFPDYFEAGRPLIERIEWIPIQDDATRVLQLTGGEIDLDLWAPLKSIPDLQAADGITVLGGPTTRYEFAELNHARAPFNDVRVRNAVALATDRQLLVDFVLGGRGEPMYGGAIGPSGNPFFNNLKVYGAPDIEKAKALIKDTGLTDITVEGLAPGGSRYAEMLQVLQQQWSQIGIKLNVNAIEAGAARARRGKGDYDLFVNGWGTMVDPNDFIGEQFLRGGGLNFSKAGDENLDALLLAGKREPDMAKRKEIYAKAESYVLEQAYSMVFIFRPYNFAAFRSGLTGLKHEAANTRMSLQTAHIEG